ncbi:phosphoribosylaminoimidazole-succinocarboxamides ynthase [Rubidibacter lacunae KORDI 51-2]|uniref:Phosphoribosylaminoimidazole-succinocarboxamide synthase n=1 Tax=Rubidibacter lacunae KORDI 51-2 TaxID=582515 RepID=U5DKX4_9CHRO|nr:phosphoribosylaminoimidazole-succinocarboxamides ynthase [Rubidibacter lacunae KORDI 51-2]
MFQQSNRPPASQPPQKLYEGKAKILYTTDDPLVLLSHFKDDATAFNAQKRGRIEGKGTINCRISAALFELLEANGVPTHFIDCPEAGQMRVRAVAIVPIEVVVRNIAAGSLCRQTGIPAGTVIPDPLVEYYYKNDDLGDPLLTRDRLFLMNLATPQQLDRMHSLALQINRVLQEFFTRCNITLVDFKLEFGCDRRDGSLLLADEISPDTCRLWDSDRADPQARILDKDRFRHDLGNIEAAYEQVQARVLAQFAGPPSDGNGTN